MKKRLCGLLVMLGTWCLSVDAEGLSEKEQHAFLSKRTTPHLLGSFNGFCSLLYAACEVAIHTESRAINSTPLQSLAPAFYKPTWRELFDSIAIQTQSAWSYDAARDYWVFAKPQNPRAYYHLEMAKEWKQDNRGEYVSYSPSIAPVGMDIYIMGTYSADTPEAANDLYQKVKESFAVTFAKHFKKDVTPADMKAVTVNTYPALHFEINVPSGIIWRQWVIVEKGQAFVIVSSIKPEHDAQLYPDVKAMISSFKIASP